MRRQSGGTPVSQIVRKSIRRAAKSGSRAVVVHIEEGCWTAIGVAAVEQIVTQSLGPAPARRFCNPVYVDERARGGALINPIKNEMSEHVLLPGKIRTLRAIPGCIKEAGSSNRAPKALQAAEGGSAFGDFAN